MSTQIDTINIIDSLVQSPNTKSYKIRALYSAGFTKSQIAMMLDIRYQHVRNVLLQVPKKST